MNNEDYNCIVYIIRQGDTLYSISRRYNVPLASILRANPFVDIYNLQINEELCIPVLNPVEVEILTDYTVVEGDTIGSILVNNNLDIEDLLLNNSLDSMFLMPGTVLKIPMSQETM